MRRGGGKRTGTKYGARHSEADPCHSQRSSTSGERFGYNALIFHAAWRMNVVKTVVVFQMTPLGCCPQRFRVQKPHASQSILKPSFCAMLGRGRLLLGDPVCLSVCRWKTDTRSSAPLYSCGCRVTLLRHFRRMRRAEELAGALPKLLHLHPDRTRPRSSVCCLHHTASAYTTHTRTHKRL